MRQCQLSFLHLEIIKRKRPRQRCFCTIWCSGTRVVVLEFGRTPQQSVSKRSGTINMCCQKEEKSDESSQIKILQIILSKRIDFFLERPPSPILQITPQVKQNTNSHLGWLKSHQNRKIPRLAAGSDRKILLFLGHHRLCMLPIVAQFLLERRGGRRPGRGGLARLRWPSRPRDAVHLLHRAMPGEEGVGGSGSVLP